MPSPRIAAATILLLLAALPCRAAETAGPAGPAVPVLPQASLLAGHFHLASPDGRTVDTDDLAGKPYGVVFGFTQCPDICPTTLSTLTTALASLPKGDLTLYFVSVDPERDGPETLARYMTSFDPRIVALTGPARAVEEAITSFGAVAQRTPLPGGGYAFSHTASILLVDGDGVIVDRIGTEVGPDRLADRLAALSGAGTRRAETPSR